MSTGNLRVLISGGGIAGTCLAYWLARASRKISITLLERSPVPRVTGQSIEIEEPALEIVKRMKLEEAILSRNTTETATEIVNSNGKAFARFDMGHVFTSKYEILRADLCELFLEVTKGFENIEQVYGDSVKSLEQTDKDVNVTFANGSPRTFDVIVGADGSGSKTRSMILEEETLKDSYKSLGQYIAFFSIPRQPSDTNVWTWYNTKKGLSIMTRPHRNNTTMGSYMTITQPAHGMHDPVVDEAMSKGTDATKKMLHEYFENAGWQSERVLEGLDSADDFYMSQAATVRLSKWHNGRGVVIGDAAHATFGVGTSLAIEGAYLLAGELSKARDSSEVPQALEEFEKVFRPLYTPQEDLPPFFPQVAFPQSGFRLWMRDSMLSFVSKTKAYKLLPADGATKFKLPDYDWREI